MAKVNRRLIAALSAGFLSATALVNVTAGASAHVATAHPHTSTVSTITLKLAKPFSPVAPKGGHDLYHCSLLNPKTTTNEMITSSTFTPGVLAEDHHAILYLVPPADAATAKKLDANGKGWTCFGGPGISGQGSIADLGSAPWLSAWAPGHGPSVEPSGTGMPLPAGSLIVMQVHYNLLTGSKPDQSKVTLKMVPAAGSNLLPLSVLLYPAAVDLPCPSGVTGKLCSRAASLKDIGARFGQSAIGFDNLLEAICSGGTPQPGDTSTCTWSVGSKNYVWQITPHMHLLGAAFKVTLNPGTPSQQVLLDVPSYNFHYQRSYLLPTPTEIKPGDRLQVSCTFDPAIRSLDPYLKTLPPRYVLWGDGSSDEMCLAILGVTSSLTMNSSVVHQQSILRGAQWPARLSALQASTPMMSFQSMTDSLTNRYTEFADLRAMVRYHLCG